MGTQADTTLFLGIRLPIEKEEIPDHLAPVLQSYARKINECLDLVMGCKSVEEFNSVLSAILPIYLDIVTKNYAAVSQIVEEHPAPFRVRVIESRRRQEQQLAMIPKDVLPSALRNNISWCLAFQEDWLGYILSDPARDVMRSLDPNSFLDFTNDMIGYYQDNKSMPPEKAHPLSTVSSFLEANVLLLVALRFLLPESGVAPAAAHPLLREWCRRAYQETRDFHEALRREGIFIVPFRNESPEQRAQRLFSILGSMTEVLNEEERAAFFAAIDG